MSMKRLGAIRKRTMAVLATVTVVGVVAVVGAAQASRSGHAAASSRLGAGGTSTLDTSRNPLLARTRYSPQLSAPRAQANLVTLRRRFGVLRRSSSAHVGRRSDGRVVAGGPSPWELRFAPVQIARYGLDLADAQYVPINGAFGVVVVPGSSGACMRWPEADQSEGVIGGGVCSPDLADIKAGGLTGTDQITPGTNARTVIGLVPDGVTSVRVGLSDGATKVVTPSSNVFAVNAGTSTYTSVAVRAGSGPFGTVG